VKERPKAFIQYFCYNILFNVNAKYFVDVLAVLQFEYFSGLTVYTMFSGARGNETNEVLNERKKETTESLRIGGIINHRLWQPDLSWSDSHRATYTYYVQEYSSISLSCMYVT